MVIYWISMTTQNFTKFNSYIIIYFILQPRLHCHLDTLTLMLTC